MNLSVTETERDACPWISPCLDDLPDFIICGAMKCGTSTIHAILEEHPDVFLPQQEINFFDLDDLYQHPDFFWRNSTSGDWSYSDFKHCSDDCWRWYRSHFSDAPEGALIGEDSTCYLPSRRACERIAMQSKQIKAIICLRQPTLRAYSQYWHMLRTGRAMFSFEDTLRFTPDYVLERSQYLRQLMHFTSFVPRQQIFFVILEQFMANKEQVLADLCDFLGIDLSRFPDNALEVHANKARFPKSVRLQAFKNRMMRTFGNETYLKSRPGMTNFSPRSASWGPRLLDAIHNSVNPSRPGKTPPMAPQTRKLLDRYFLDELKGLSDLVGTDVESLWF